MGLARWSKSSLDYTRRVLNSGLEGACSGQEAFLKGKPLTAILSESARSACKSAAIGAFIGMLGSSPWRQDRSVRRTCTYGLLGAVIGFGAGVVWESRRLTASVAGGALRNIEKVRDEHWFEKHPIDYA